MILIRLFTFGLAVLGATINNKPPADSELVYEVNTTTPGESHVIPNRWMVYLKKDSEKTPAEHAGWATSLHEDHSGGFRGVMNVFNLVILEQKGYNGEFTDWTVEQIRKDKDVSYIFASGFRSEGPNGV